MATTDTTNGAALAVREFSDKQIRTRLEAASKPGFGMEKATRDQLNMIYLLAKHYDVDPAIDITLFQGRPFFTIDGRVRLMKRHPQYRGYRVRPLPKAEKEAWGYREDEIVVECAIRTESWGEITARGKVSPDEFRRQPVAASHPQEMAEKRAIARASRMAFGQDVPDEDEVGYLIEQAADPARQAALAAKYDEIYPPDELDVPAEVARPEPEEDSKQERLKALLAMARRRDLEGTAPKPGKGEDATDVAIAYWERRVSDYDLDQQAAKESGVLL